MHGPHRARNSGLSSSVYPMSQGTVITRRLCSRRCRQMVLRSLPSVFRKGPSGDHHRGWPPNHQVRTIGPSRPPRMVNFGNQWSITDTLCTLFQKQHFGSAGGEIAPTRHWAAFPHIPYQPLSRHAGNLSDDLIAVNFWHLPLLYYLYSLQTTRLLTM